MLISPGAQGLASLSVRLFANNKEDKTVEDIIRTQRETVAEHFQAENIHDWPAVHKTFVQDESAYYDVVPLSTKFKGISGVKDFYQTIGAALPDFHVKVTGEYDTPGAPSVKLHALGPIRASIVACGPARTRYVSR